VKRVVTGLNEKGQSAVLEVGPPPRVWTWTASQDSAPHHVSRTLIDHFPDLSELAPSQGVSTELWVTHTTATTVACYSGTGFEPALWEAARSGEVVLVGLDRLYQP